MEALVSVVGKSEGGDDQLAAHTAELPAESLHVLADPLVPTANNTDRGAEPWELGTPTSNLDIDGARQIGLRL